MTYMGRGSSQPSSTYLPRENQDKNLVDLVFIGNAALENWSRFSDGPEELPTARSELLQTIREHGILSSERPLWMSQDKPGISLWIHLPKQISLELEEREDSKFQYQANNALAPKSVRQKSRPARALRKSPAVNPDLVERIAALSGLELAESIHLSVHCLEQFNERNQCLIQGRDLTDLVLETGRIIAIAPRWAAASGREAPVLLVDFDGSEVAMPLAENSFGDNRPLVATTSIPRHWSESGLHALRGQDLADAVHISSSAARALAKTRRLDLSESAIEALKQEIALAIAAAEEIEYHRGSPPHIALADEGILILRAANAEQRRKTQQTWIVADFKPAEATPGLA